MSEGSTIFDHVAEGRTCGACVACCHLLEINKPELQKKADVLCPHCTGSGCGIYSTRPEVCKTWFCLWRRLPQMPDYLRPDKAAVMFSIAQRPSSRMPFERLYIIARALSAVASFSRPDVKAAIDMFVEQGSLPVWLSFGGRKWMVYPSVDLADAVMSPATTAHQHLIPQAVEWRRRLELE